MHELRKILFPFSWLYGAITSLRNKLYDRDILKSHSYDLPIIGVGNLSVGGTGKSPMVEYLIALLKNNYNLATLSRGYKRSTSGFYLLEGHEQARQVGDEPLQFKRKYPSTLVAVDEVRTRGIETLLALPKPPEVILLDDAFQHRKVRAGLYILLTSYDNLYSNDSLLPAGNLREPIHGRKRARIVIVTKCPLNLSQKDQQKIARKLKLLPNQELFFTGIGYNEQVFSHKQPISLNQFIDKEFVLVTGIAKPAPLVEYLQGQGLKFQHLSFPDHHNFTEKELKVLRGHKLLLTTEKDYMRLRGEMKDKELYYLPIKTLFLSKTKEFNELIYSYVEKK